jgi:hypothetical protein
LVCLPLLHLYGGYISREIAGNLGFLVFFYFFFFKYIRPRDSAIDININIDVRTGHPEYARGMVVEEEEADGKVPNSFTDLGGQAHGRHGMIGW